MKEYDIHYRSWGGADYHVTTHAWDEDEAREWFENHYFTREGDHIVEITQVE